MSYLWWIIGGVIVLSLLSGGKKNNAGRSGSSGRPVRVDRPHVFDDDDYECSVCHRRFRKNVMVCPHCGVRFAGRVTDEEEFDEEEEEMEAWDEEDGI